MKIELVIHTDALRGKTYQDFIQFLFKNSDEFYVVTRTMHRKYDYASEPLNTLLQHCTKEYKANSWAGTKTSGGYSAVVHHLRCERTTRLLLQNSADCLSDWIWPKLPEDPTFLWHGEPWFYSTTHEKQGRFQITDDTEHLLPQIRNYLNPQLIDGLVYSSGKASRRA